MKLMLATIKDLPDIMMLIHHAQQLLHERGIDQWQNGYPNIETIQNDILQQQGFVVVEQQKVCATVMISADTEPTYQVIDGEWLCHQPYMVMHRMAVDPMWHGKRIAEFIFQEVALMCRRHHIGSIRVDTHPDNRTVQHILTKLNFVYCGKITVQYDDDALRWAYEKQLAI